MIDLTKPEPEVIASIKRAATAGHDEALKEIARHAKSGYRSWCASKQSRRGDALHNLLTKSIASLLDKNGTVPGFDETAKTLWEIDSTDKPCIIDISGKHRFVIWRDSTEEYQKTSFKLISQRIDRILKKLGLSTKA